ncbi:MAG TPA: CdaR family protein [Syntrophorhabdaceae bacterium]|nr:CdaR family protein [Syntrophorhabdaceae bacterium]HOL05928.1 CdaR family protein [Syntrophorhabdaceae bacterium]HON86184.1 CdaR family protein [Syntrophorhabdaceae bacterium]HOT42508.1 CdaR family protein [Syntrophorhabdaceae bacterium]HPC67607.1 CdaR family protein [Syntrophorhabdaceae bacterium]
MKEKIKRLLSYIIRDIRLKILSIILAILFWFAVSYTGDTKMTISVPVTLNNLARQYIIKNTDPDSVLLSISGPVSIMKNLRARDIKIVIDLSEIKEGRYTLNLSRENVILPNGLKAEDIKPDYINLEIDGVIEKRLKTVARLDKKWSDIYKIKSLYPQYVTVEGSRESLKDKDTIETNVIDGNFLGDEEEVDIGLDTRGITLKRIRPETVRVILKRM